MFNRSCTNSVFFLYRGEKKINPWFYYDILLTVLTEYFTSKTACFEELTLLLLHSSLMLTVVDGIL